jgi:hypothetical protein
MSDLLTRVGAPIRVPFTDRSASTPFDMTDLLPKDANGEVRSDLVFAFSNTTMYDVRLEGTKGDGPLVQVTEKTGHSVMARTEKGTFASKKPNRVSCQAFPTNGAPIAADADFSNCFLELQYYVMS